MRSAVYRFFFIVEFPRYGGDSMIAKGSFYGGWMRVYGVLSEAPDSESARGIPSVAAGIHNFAIYL